MEPINPGDILGQITDPKDIIQPVMYKPTKDLEHDLVVVEDSGYLQFFANQTAIYAGVFNLPIYVDLYVPYGYRLLITSVGGLTYVESPDSIETINGNKYMKYTNFCVSVPGGSFKSGDLIGLGYLLKSPSISLKKIDSE